MKKMRENINPANVGAAIKGFRRTNADKMLVELKRGNRGALALSRAIGTVLGEQAAVRPLIPTDRLEIRGLDEITTMEEMQVAMVAALKGGKELMDLKEVTFKPFHRSFRVTSPLT